MVDRRVVWTATVAKQRRKILKYWLKRNKSNTYPLKLLQLSDEKTKIIAQNPELFHLSDYPETRVAPMGHFSIYYNYKTTDTEIIITAFWDNRQSPKKLIRILKEQDSGSKH